MSKNKTDSKAAKLPFYKKKWFRLLLMLGIITAFVFSYFLITAKAEEGYRLTEGNELVFDYVVSPYKKSNNKNAIRYSTQGWYMFSEDTRMKVTPDKLDASYFTDPVGTGAGTKVETYANGTYLSRLTANPKQVLEFLLQAYSKKGRAYLRDNPSTIYLNPVVKVHYFDANGNEVSSKVYDGKTYTSRLYYNLQYLLAAAPYGWSAATEETFRKDYYYRELGGLRLEYCDVSIKFVDKKGNEVGGFSCADPYDGFAFYGETIDMPAFTGENEEYQYCYYVWSDTGQGGEGKDPSAKYVDYDSVNTKFTGSGLSGVNDTKGSLTLYFVFEKKTDELTVTTQCLPAGSGTTKGDGVYEYQENVTLTATAKEGYTFVRWMLDYNSMGSTRDTYTFRMPDTDVVATAIFKPNNSVGDKYTVTTSCVPSGAGDVAGGGTYEEGAKVELAATANEGYMFDSWSLSTGETSKESTYSFTMPPVDITVTANFVPEPTQTPGLKRITIASYSKIFHDTTSEHYNIVERMENGRLADYKSWEGTNALSKAFSGVLSKRNYSIGYDNSGNKWYFIPVGDSPYYDRDGNLYYNSWNATYVHPYIYQGNDVNTKDVANISMLTFPSYVYMDVTNPDGSTEKRLHWVTSIGGANSYYYKGGGGNATSSVSCTNVKGGYFKSETLALGTEHTLDIEYRLGVIGNGQISSVGTRTNNFSSTARNDTYTTQYNVYNNTLVGVYIPANGREITIEPYAFHNCQALTTISFLFMAGNPNGYVIGDYAFPVVDKPTSKISYRSSGRTSDPANDTVTIYNDMHYYYYNGAYSLRDKTASMLSWEKQMQIGQSMKFPEIPTLTTLGVQCFANRTHLSDVALPDTVTNVGADAFKNCTLDNVKVPSQTTVIEGGVDTLGTKGRVKNLTVIETVAGANAMDYGFAHYLDYKVKSGILVTYEPNGGTPATPVTESSELEYGEPTFTDNVKGSFYLDEEGVLRQFTCTYIAPNRDIVDYMPGSAMPAESILKGTIVPEAQHLQFAQIISASFQQKNVVESNNHAHTVDTHTVYLRDISGQGWKLYVSKGNDSQYGRAYTYTTLTKANIAAPSPTPTPAVSGPTPTPVPVIRSGVVADAWSSCRVWAWGEKLGTQTTIYGNTRLYLTDDGKLFKTTEYDPNKTDDFQGETVDVMEYYEDRPPGTYQVSPEGVTFQWALPLVARVQPEREYNASYVNNATVTSTTEPSEGISFVALDTEGYLWHGRICTANYWNYGHEGQTCDESSFKCVSGLKFTDMVYKEITCVAKEWDYAPDGFQHDYTEDHKGIIIVLKSESGRCYGISVKNYWEDASLLYPSSYYYYFPEYELKTLNYTNPVDHFLSFPLYMDTTGNVRSLLTTDTTLEVFGGAFFPIDIKSNKFRNPGMDFDSWNTGAAGTGTKYIPGQHIELKSYNSNWSDLSNLTLYAQWVGEREKPNYIHYNSNGGGGTMPSTEVPVGTTTATLAANTFTRKGYLFTGWNTRADGDGEPYADKATLTGITKSKTLYAQWEPLTYTVEYAKSPYGVTPVKIVDSFTIEFEEEFRIREGVEEQSLAVSYDLNQPVYTITDAKFLETTPLGDEFTKAEVSFLEWNMYRKDGSTYQYGGRTYKANETVSGLSTTENEVLTMFPSFTGSRVILPGASCEGYEFLGWTESKNDTSNIHYVDDNSPGIYLPKGNDTLYGAWAPATYLITLNSDLDDGSAADNPGSTYTIMTFGEKGADITIPSEPHYVFKGYFTEPKGKGDQYYDRNGNGTKVWLITDGSIDTLYAYWVPDKAIQYEANYTPVAENDRAGDEYTTWTEYIETEDTYFTLSKNIFTRRGYTFTKWTTNANGSGTSYADKAKVATSAIDGVVPIYARWTPIKYSVVYDLKGNKPDASTTPVHATPTPPATATYDKSIEVHNPGREGYTFLGWNITGMDDCTHTYGGKTTTATSLTNSKVYGYKNLRCTPGTVTFTAQWQVNTYPVKLDGRGATSTNHTKNVIMTFDAACPSITVPAKTGYTFMGYYTDVRGAGTQYYDADGKSVKPWTETDVDTLYAYWKQKPVVLPEEDDYIVPDVEEEVVIEGNVGRTDGKALLYADDYNDATGALTDLQPYLTYDTGGSTGVIPGTENLSFRAKMGSWILAYKFYKNAGLDYVKITVTVPYRTQYEISETEELVISDVQTKDYTISVPRAWSYWEVLESGMYYPDSVKIGNEVLAGDGTVTVSVDRTGAASVDTPDYSATNHGEKKEHVKWPAYAADGAPVLTIELSEEQYIISDRADVPPSVDPHNRIVAKNAAWRDNREPEVRSDYYKFDGEVVLSDEWYYTNGASLNQGKLPANADAVELTGYEQTYASGIELDELKPNGQYETTAEITYTGDASNIGAAATKTVELADINDLNIHTPVACDGVITDGVEHTKDENGDELAVLTLKDALNFFTLRIDNTGTHLMSLGYGYKNFATALSGKGNIATDNGSVLNQVQFPFDVYVDVGNDSRKADGSYDTTGDYLLCAGEWFTTGVELRNYYIPVTSENGKFTINFRSIAVNCLPDENGQDMEAYKEKAANLNPQNYIATDSLEMEIESYIKDFRIVSVEDPKAEAQLENGAGIVTMKKGYGFTYQLRTQGEFFGENVEIQTIPRYYWEPEAGGSRQEVHLYRMDSLLSGESRECYAWDTEPLLLVQKNYEVILQRFSGRGMIPADVLCVPVDEQEIFEEYVNKQTITGKEAIMKQNGYIYISFEIRVKSNQGKWYFLETGDVIGYNLSQSIEDDYEVGGME